MIKTYIYLILIAFFCAPVVAQETGSFCFTYEIPTETVEGNPASTVGVSKVYFEIAQFSGADVTYRDSWEALEADFSDGQHCFTNVPVGAIRFANRAYDFADCPGEVSPITDHEIYADREKLKPATVNVIVTGAVPDSDPDPIH